MRFFRKRKNKTYSSYQGFPYYAHQLLAYLADKDYYILAIDGGKVVHYHPKDMAAFRAWLDENKVRDINVPLRH